MALLLTQSLFANGKRLTSDHVIYLFVFFVFLRHLLDLTFYSTLVAGIASGILQSEAEITSLVSATTDQTLERLGA